MRRIHIIVLVLILALAVLAAVKLDLPSLFRAAPEEPDKVEPEPEPEPEPDIRTARLTAVGDMFPHGPQITGAHQGGGSYDFEPAFRYLKPYFQDSDLTTLDLETTQAGAERGYSGYPAFNAPLQLSEALKEAGVDLYVAATNHIVDRGLSGLQTTLEDVRELGFITTGAYLSREERDTPVIVDLNGIKVAFISYTYRIEGSLPAGHEYAVNIAYLFEDISPVIADIKSARAAGADLVVAVPHWGEQYIDYPFEEQRAAARKMAEAGADLILGGHPKYVQPCEWIELPEEGGITRAVPAIYSLGNFYTDQHYPSCPSELVEYGMLLTLELSKDMDSGRAWVSDVDYDIHWCQRDRRHRMLLLSEVFEKGPEEFNLSQAQLEKLRENYRKNVEIIERYGFTDNRPAGVK